MRILVSSSHTPLIALIYLLLETFGMAFFLTRVCSADDIIIESESISPTITGSEAKTIIYRSSIQDKSQRVADIIDSIAGVHIRKSGQATNIVSIRGLSGTKVKILLDGVPLSEAGTTNSVILDLPAQFIERIELQRGANSDRYGSGAMGGTINIITQRKTLNPSLQVSAGSFGTTKVSGQSQIGLNRINLGLIASFLQSKRNYQLANGAELANNQIQQWNGKIEISDNTKDFPLRFSAIHQGKEQGISGNTGRLLTNVKEKSDSTQLNLNFEPKGTETLVFTNSITLTASNRKTEDKFGEINGFPTIDIEKNDLLINQLDLQSFPWEFLELYLKVDLTRERYTDGFFSKSRKSSLTSLMGNVNLFDEKLILSPRIAYHATSKLQNRFTVGFGMKYSLNSLWSVQSNIATGFRNPSFQELYSIRGLTVGNTNLDAEETIGGDVSIIYNDESTKFAFGYFLQKTEKLIDYLLISGFRFRPFNFQESLIEGIEFSAAFDALKFLKFETDITAQQAINNDKSSEYFNRLIPNQPRFFGKQKIQCKIGSKWSIEPSFSFATDRYLNRANTQKLPDRFLFAITNNYVISKKMNLSVVGENIFNRDNIDIRGQPNANRSIYASISYSM